MTDDDDLQLRAQRIGANAMAAMERRHRATPLALEPDPEGAADPESADWARVRSEAVWRSCIPERFVWADLPDFDDQPPATRDALADWTAEPAGRNLLLLGPVGVGKTHAGVAALREVHRRGTEVRFLPVVELLDLLRPGGPDGAFYDLADVEVLMVDDLGSERPTEWTAERLYALVNRRWLEERPTVCTTNLPPEAKHAPAGYDGPTLADQVGERIYSRLVGNGAVAVRLTGPDRRRTR